MSYRDPFAGLRERVIGSIAELGRILDGASAEVLAHLPAAYRDVLVRGKRVIGTSAASFESLSALAKELDELLSAVTDALAKAERSARASKRRGPRRRKVRVAAPETDGSAIAPANFKISTEERIRAMTIGAPAWALRKRKIEDAIDRFVGELLDRRDRLLAQGVADDDTTEPLLAHARTLKLAPIQKLIEQHNRYYPIEANLSMSPNGYMISGEPWQPEPDLTPERMLSLVDAALEPASVGPRSRRAGPPSARRPAK